MLYRSAKLVLLLMICAGCHQNIEIENPLPEFLNLSGPVGFLNDVDHKISTITADPKGWSDTSVYLRYVRDEEDLLKSPDSTEMNSTCSDDGAGSVCKVIFPVSGVNQTPVFEVGTTVYYQWFIDYQLPGGSEVATVESPVNSFVVIDTIPCLNNDQCSGLRICGAGAIAGDPTDEGVQLKVCYHPPCPIGANGELCSGHGQCNADTGQCVCDDEKYTQADCGTVCQRCYGAAGNQCGPSEGEFGYCTFIGGFSLPTGMSMREACESDEIEVPNVHCKISVGSWTHDECCISDGEYSDCFVGAGFGLDAVCQDEANLVSEEFAQLLNPFITPRVWTRMVDPCIEVCGVHGPDAERVRAADMCADPGDTLSCTNVANAGAFCCSGVAIPTGTSGICQCN